MVQETPAQGAHAKAIPKNKPVKPSPSVYGTRYMATKKATVRKLKKLAVDNETLTNAANQLRKLGRAYQAKIPVGHRHMIFKPEDKVFVIRAGVPWPPELMEWVEEQATAKARQLVAQQSQNTFARNYLPQESFAEALAAILRHSPADQNRIMGSLFRELTDARNRVADHLQDQSSEIDRQLLNAIALQTELSLIKQDKFATL